MKSGKLEKGGFIDTNLNLSEWYVYRKIITHTPTWTKRTPGRFLKVNNCWMFQVKVFLVLCSIDLKWRTHFIDIVKQEPKGLSGNSNEMWSRNLK